MITTIVNSFIVVNYLLPIVLKLLFICDDRLILISEFWLIVTSVFFYQFFFMTPWRIWICNTIQVQIIAIESRNHLLLFLHIHLWLIQYYLLRPFTLLLLVCLFLSVIKCFFMSDFSICIVICVKARRRLDRCFILLNIRLFNHIP